MRDHRATLLLGAGCLIGFLAVSSSSAGAQHGTLRGIVVDSAGAPIADVSVGIAALRQLTRTNDQGQFVLRRVSSGPVEVSVRRLGFQPKTVSVSITDVGGDSIIVKLLPQAEVLEGVAVSATEVRHRMGIEGFHQRRIRGVGIYVTREEIVARGTNLPSDVLRNTPGVRIVRLRGGDLGVRFVSAVAMRRDCMPMVWIDGQKAPGMEIDAISAMDLEGIELYNGPSTTPFQFSQTSSMSTCGAIVFWSRTPGS